MLELKERYCVPALISNIISVSYLTMNDGFEFRMKGNGCTIILNKIYYGSVTYHNGLYVLDLDRLVLNLKVKRQEK